MMKLLKHFDERASRGSAGVPAGGSARGARGEDAAELGGCSGHLLRRRGVYGLPRTGPPGAYRRL